jgi:hypothetical protein
MSERKAAQRRTRKNHKYGDLVKKVVESSGRSQQTVYAVLRGTVRSRPIEDAIDAYYKTLEPAKAADRTGAAQ